MNHLRQGTSVNATKMTTSFFHPVLDMRNNVAVLMIMDVPVAQEENVVLAIVLDMIDR